MFIVTCRVKYTKPETLVVVVLAAAVVVVDYDPYICLVSSLYMSVAIRCLM